MNKARRHELKMLKFKKRLNQLGLKESDNCNYSAYRSHGKPCSCFFCSHDKYQRAKEKGEIKNELSELNEVDEYEIGFTPLFFPIRVVY